MPGRPPNRRPGRDGGTTASDAQHSGWRRRLATAEAVFLALLIAATVGIGIADYSPRAGFYYWVAMVPLFGAVSLASRGRHVARTLRTRDVVREELLHWIGTLGALYLVMVLVRTGRMNNEAAGLVALLVLALATFLAGVRSSPALAAVGLVLGAATAVAAILQQYLWVGFLPAVVVALLAWSFWRFGRRRSAE